MKKNDNEILKDLQKAELEILKEFIRVCDKLNLQYYLAAGTCLGAVRHKGFIPWDDDIDVYMLRNDYEILLKKGPSVINSRYFIQSYESDVEYPHNFGKIRDSKTTFIESSLKNLNINHGIYIDIFPFDNYDPSKRFANCLEKIKLRLINIQLYKYFYNPNSKSFKQKMGRFISNVFYKKYNMHELSVLKDNMAKKHNKVNTQYYRCYGCANNKLYYPKDIFGKGKLVKFEDIMARIPNNYDQYLKILYNNYMELPKEEERQPHHYSEAVDVSKSYTFYTKSTKKKGEK